MAKIESFRFWCQKVLPLVYDESLSYYELLCKMTTYLNNTIQAVNENTADTAQMRLEITQFENFINNYFDNLDVQQEINNKLDAMAASGELDTILAPFVPDAVADWLSEHITPTTPAVDNTLSISGAAADSKTVGDILNTGIVLRDSSELTDLDDATQAGYYMLAYSASYANCPVAGSTRRVLICYRTGGVIYQFLYTLYNKYNAYCRAYASNAWSDWERVNDDFSNSAADSITDADLNNATKNGFYLLATSANYTHSPVGNNTRRLLVVYKHDSYTMQIMFNLSAPFEIFTRFYINDSTGWRDWNECFNNTLRENAASSITDNDLNNAITKGYYYLAYSTTYTNSPITGGERKVLCVYSTGSQVAQVLYTFEKTQDIYTRFYTSGAGWSAWKKQLLKEDNELITNIVGSEASISAAPIASLKLMTYNVANWNNDTSTYISDEKIHNVRMALNVYPADIYCCQEDKAYIDNSSKRPLDYIFRNAIDKIGETTATVYSSLPRTSQIALDMAGGNGRVVRVVYMTIADKKVALLNLHATSHVGDTDHSSPENIAQRVTELTSVHNFVNGTGTLKQHNTDTDVSFADDVDYTIICGDFNTITETDRTNIQTIFSDMKLCNGGFLGWLDTVPRSKFTCDNVIVSSNVGIKTVNSLTGWYDKLYSDHVPFVVELTLN